MPACQQRRFLCGVALEGAQVKSSRPWHLIAGGGAQPISHTGHWLPLRRAERRGWRWPVPVLCVLSSELSFATCRGKKGFPKASMSPGNQDPGNSFVPVITASCKTVRVCFLLKLLLWWTSHMLGKIKRTMWLWDGLSGWSQILVVC